MIRIQTLTIDTAQVRRGGDTKAQGDVKFILNGLESDIDTEDTTGVRNLIRRALADTKHSATALPDGRIVMNDRYGLKTIGYWEVA